MDINGIRKATLPNLFIVGAAKSGTTSLGNYLCQHPDIYMSPIKEPNYFSSDIDTTQFRRSYKMQIYNELDKYFSREVMEQVHIAFIHDWEQYLKLFSKAERFKIRGEASVSYLYSKEAARNIFKKLPHARIIILLRNPIDRAYSQYLMNLRDGNIYTTFHKALLDDMHSAKKGWGISNLYIELGLYYEQVKRYIEVFPVEQIKIYLYEDLMKRDALWNDMLSFVGVDVQFRSNENIQHNKAVYPKSKIANYLLKNAALRIIRNYIPSEAISRTAKQILLSNKVPPPMSVEDRDYLNGIFYHDLIRLEQLVGRDLSAWYA